VVYLNNTGYVSAADYGTGHLVVSSAGLGNSINGLADGISFNNARNMGVVSGEAVSSVPATELKLVFNMIAWQSSVPTAGGNSRRTGANTEVIGASLGRKWSINLRDLAPGIGTNQINVGSGVAVHKGVAFQVDGRNILHAYEINPSRDNDVPQDSGVLADHISLGTSYDEIWRVNLGLNTTNVRVSTPTIFTLSTSAGPKDYLAITTTDGQTLIYDALRQNGVGQYQDPVLAATIPGTGGAASLLASLAVGNTLLPVPSPAYSEGLLFTVGYDPARLANTGPWRVAAIDPLTGASIFGSAGTGASAYVAPTPTALIGGLGPIIGSLTAGYIRDDSTGALDKVIYTPTRTLNAQTEGDVVAGIWFNTKNEPLTTVNNSTTVLQPLDVQRRLVCWWAPTDIAGLTDASRKWLPIVRIVRADGTVVSLSYPTDIDVSFSGTTGTRTMQVTLKTTALNTGDTAYADYTLNWPALGTGSAGAGMAAMTAPELQRMFDYRRFRTFLPGQGNNPYLTLVGGMAITGSDSLVTNVNNLNATGIGRIYNTRDQFSNSTLAGQTAANAVQQTQSIVNWMWSPQVGGTNGATADFDPAACRCSSCLQWCGVCGRKLRQHAGYSGTPGKPNPDLLLPGRGYGRPEPVQYRNPAEQSGTECAADQSLAPGSGKRKCAWQFYRQDRDEDRPADGHTKDQCHHYDHRCP
jgi:hypothetical protein